MRREFVHVLCFEKCQIRFHEMMDHQSIRIRHISQMPVRVRDVQFKNKIQIK